MDQTVEETNAQKQRKADEAVQLVMGVALIAFAVIVVATLLTMRVSEVLSHPY